MLTNWSVLRVSGSALLAQASWQHSDSSPAKSDLTELQTSESSLWAAGSPSELLAGRKSDFPAGKDSVTDSVADRSPDMLAGSKSDRKTAAPCTLASQVPSAMSILLVSVEHMQQWLPVHKVGSAAILDVCIPRCYDVCGLY